ncbi:MAG: zf-HC2 domain-containing protein [Planctomycetota bacterium]
MSTHATPDLDPACRRLRGRLALLLDGGLSPVEAARDEGHLEACAGCRAEREAWERTTALAAEALGGAAGELAWALSGLDGRLEDAFAARRRSRLRRLAGGAVASAATAAAALLALFVLRFGGLSLDEHSALARLSPLPTLDLRLPDWASLLGGTPLGEGDR